MYEARDFSHLIGMEGFSEKLLKDHFKLYNGYVTNTNKCADLIKTSDGYLKNEARRRFGWEFNGMRLHEMYFDNMTKDNKELTSDGDLKKQIETDFGSYDAWLNDFKGTASLRGIGWTVLYYDQTAKKLFNVWIAEHALNHLAGTKPLLVLDVWEHAYIGDYSLDRGSYFDAFMNVVNWETVEKRLK